MDLLWCHQQAMVHPDHGAIYLQWSTMDLLWCHQQAMVHPVWTMINHGLTMVPSTGDGQPGFDHDQPWTDYGAIYRQWSTMF